MRASPCSSSRDRARLPSRSSYELASAVGAPTRSPLGASLAEAALVAADESRSLGRQRFAARLANGLHLERHPSTCCARYNTRWVSKETTQRDEDLATSLGEGRIRCPKCSWRPSRHDRWQCSCLHAWNTFDTRGRCAACRKQWLDTQCRRCAEWSPHESWYVRGGSRVSRTPCPRRGTLWVAARLAPRAIQLPWKRGGKRTRTPGTSRRPLCFRDRSGPGDRFSLRIESTRGPTRGGATVGVLTRRRTGKPTFPRSGGFPPWSSHVRHDRRSRDGRQAKRSYLRTVIVTV